MQENPPLFCKRIRRGPMHCKTVGKGLLLLLFNIYATKLKPSKYYRNLLM
uniref:Uncharacterized protein n=1 Tax=Rhizophora mucronata TaxID=61149 RepID=A0A2P2IPN9_RHIMU